MTLLNFFLLEILLLPAVFLVTDDCDDDVVELMLSGRRIATGEEAKQLPKFKKKGMYAVVGLWRRLAG